MKDKAEEDFVLSVQSHLTSLTTPVPESKPSVDKEPEPTAERETQLMPTTDTVSEPMAATEPEPAASSTTEESLYQSELEEEEWQVDREVKEQLPPPDSCL